MNILMCDQAAGNDEISNSFGGSHWTLVRTSKASCIWTARSTGNKQGVGSATISSILTLSLDVCTYLKSILHFDE